MVYQAPKKNNNNGDTEEDAAFKNQKKMEEAELKAAREKGEFVYISVKEGN